MSVLSGGVLGGPISSGGSGGSVTPTDLQNYVQSAASNPLLNGDFSLWQGGTSFATGYTADQWYLTDGAADVVFERAAFTAGQTAVPGNPTYYAAITRTTTTGTDDFSFMAIMENAGTLATNTVTISFYAKTTGADVEIDLLFRQDFGTGGSPSTSLEAVIGSVTVSGNTWARYDATVSVPTTAGKTFGSNGDSYAAFKFGIAGDQIADTESLHISNVQPDFGSLALAWRPLNPTSVWKECARYYWVVDGLAIQSGVSAGAFAETIVFPVPMRVSPAVSLGSPAAQANVSSLTVEYISTTAATPYMGTGAGAAFYNDFAATFDSRISP